KLQALYRTAEDAGLHAATEWLLRRWKQNEWLKRQNEVRANDREQRARQTERTRREFHKASAAASAPRAEPQWYVTNQGQTMVVIPGPVEFLMGSPPT